MPSSCSVEDLRQLQGICVFIRHDGQQTQCAKRRIEGNAPTFL